MKNGFHEDKSTQRFCAVLILSAIDEARQKPQQADDALSPEQAQARYFLLAKENRAMVTQLIEAMGLDPSWFFARVLRRLVQNGWPCLPEEARPTSRVHGSGLYVFFDEDRP